jgi:mRNA interferase RelE/StbE
MPWYRLAFHPTVVTDLTVVDRSTAQRLFDKTKWLASNVDNLRHDPVSAELSTLSKYSVGEWRIFYSINRFDNLIDIHCISRGSDPGAARR